MKVLFLCTGNSARSQMAEGLLRWVGGSVVDVASAGTHPKPVHPLAVQVMRETGMDISRQQSKSAEQFLDQPFDLVITDQRMPRQQGTDLLGRVRRTYPGIVRILTTAHADIEAAIDAVNSGAMSQNR